jgi:lipopolysaccharide transport system permease protein
MLSDVNKKFSSPFLYLREMWRYRQIVLMLFRNRVLSAHKGKYLGNLWYFLDPLFQLLVWVFIFQFVFRIRRENYPIFLFCGITCWSFLGNSWREGCSCVTGMGNFMFEVNFPKMLLVVNVVFISLYYIAFQIFILFFMLYVAKIGLTVNILYLPLVISVMVLMGLGGGMLFAVIGIFIRDFPNILKPALRLWWFLSPALYSIERIPLKYRDIFKLNPLCGLFQTVRNIVLYGKSPTWDTFFITVIFGIALFAIGFSIFYKIEPDFTKNI